MRRSSLILPAVAMVVLSACSGGDTDTAKDPASSPAPSADGTVECTYTDDGTPPAREVDAPETQAPATGVVTAVIATNHGDIGLSLDRAAAPCTVNSFVSLAEQGYYDDTICPRVGNAPGFGILQCGDPSGTSAGGPGYTFDDELTGGETYSAGTLAMANRGPNTNGSQFFLVFADSGFRPDYTVFGEIDEAGLEVLRTIAENGDDGSNPAGGGVPNEPVEITSVTIG